MLFQSLYLRNVCIDDSLYAKEHTLLDFVHLESCGTFNIRCNALTVKPDEGNMKLILFVSPLFVTPQSSITKSKVVMMTTTSSLFCILFVCLVAYMVGGGDAMASKSFNIRQLQTNQTLNYRATYKADFQHLRDFQCMLTEPPLLELTCYGSVMIILNVSDPSISCSRLVDPNINNGTTYQCTTSCASACSTVYENSGDAGDGPFGSIEFICEGDDYRQVDAEYLFTSGTDGECVFRSEPQTRNYHVARFGVSCPTLFGREYVYDDTYFECLPRGSSSPGFALDLSAVGDADVYFCLSGDNCLGEPCTVPYDELRIRATLPSFLDECVESLVPLTSPPTNAPAISSSSTEYTVQYQASWGRLYDSEASRQSCQGSNPTVMITCEDEASIMYLNSTDSSMVCDSLTGNDLSCTGNAALIENNFTSIVYVSKAVHRFFLNSS